MAEGTTTLDWVRPLPQKVRARCETALWWLGLPAVLWAAVAQLWASWAWIPAGLAAAWLLFMLGTARLHVRELGWACTDDALLARRGWFRQSVRSIPWSRVRSVELSEGPIDSRLGLGSLVVKIPGLGQPVEGLALDRARELRAEILARARLPRPDAGNSATAAADGARLGATPDAAADGQHAATAADGQPAAAPDAADGRSGEGAVAAQADVGAGSSSAGSPTTGLALARSASAEPPSAVADVPDGLEWFRAHPLSGVASWVSTTLWLGAFGVYFLLRESEDVPSVVGVVGRLASDARVVVGACAVAVLFVLGTVWSEVVRRRTAWALGPSELHERFTGRSRRHAVVPFDRVDRVDLAASLGERLLGLSRLTVMTAAGDDRTEIGPVPSSQAEGLRGRIMHAAGGPTSSPGSHVTGPDAEPAASDAPAAAPAGHRGPGQQIAVTDRRTAVRALIVRDPVLPAAVAGCVGGLVALVMGSSEPVFFALGAFAFAGRRAWQGLDASVGRTVSTTVDGLVVTSGLGTRTERTLRAGRTHAVRLSRRAAWWGADLWTVTALSGASGAADEQEDDDEISGALVTVADARVALAVAQEALPDLSRVDRRLLRDVWPAEEGAVVPDPDVDGTPVSVLRVPDRARWLHPFTWRVRVAALVADGLLVRTGWLAPRVTFVPLRHVQGVTLDEGPLLRRAGVVAVDVHLVEGPVKVVAGPLEPAAGRHLAGMLARAAAAPVQRREDWLDGEVLTSGRMGA